MKKRILSLAIVLVMALGFFPALSVTYAATSTARAEWLLTSGFVIHRAGAGLTRADTGTESIIKIIKGKS